MTLPKPPAPAEPVRQHRNALLTGQITLGMMILLIIFGIYLVVQSPTWDQYTVLGVFITLALASAANVWLNRRGHAEAGMLMYLFVNFAVYPAIAFVVSGVGLLLAAVCVFLNSIIAILTLPRRYLTLVTVMSVAVGISVLVLDFYVPMPWRKPTPQPGIMLSFVAVLSIIYLGFMLTQIRTFTLRGKLTLAFIAVSLASVSVVAVITSFLSQQNLTQAANASLLAAARQTGSQIDELIRGRLAIVSAEAQDPAVVRYLSLPPDQRAGTEAETLAALRSFQSQDLTHIVSTALFDRQGIDLVDTYAADVGQNKSDRSYFQETLRSSAPYVSSIEFWRTASEPSLYFSAPVRNAAGEVVGVLRFRCTADIVQNLVFKSNGLAGAQSYAAVFDENLISLANGLAPQLAFKAPAPLDAAQLAKLQAARRLPAEWSLEQINMKLPELEAGLRRADAAPFFNSAQFLPSSQQARAAVTRIQYQPWLVVFFAPEEVVLAPVQAQNKTLTLIAVLIAGLAALAAVGIGQVLTDPIIHLTRVAAQISSGGLDVQARVTSADEIGALALTFNSMTTRLRDTIGTLEQRVAERTRAVEASAQVSRHLSTITDAQQLVLAVVEEVQQAFNFYHAHIYLFDAAHENLVMAGGTGEAGRTMLSRGHKLPRGRGLVGRAAETRQAVLVADTASDPRWLPNPLLPETKSEVAVPIMLGEQVLGVLDVQHNVVNGLKPADADLLGSIASQIAIALQNARSYTQTRQLARREALINTIGQKIQSATTVEEVLQVTVKELGQALDAQHASAQLGASSDAPPAPPIPAEPWPASIDLTGGPA